MYNFFRDGRVYTPHFIYSDDLGKTWSKERTQFVDDGNPKRRQRPYARYCSNGSDTIYVTFTDGHPRKCNNNVYFAKFKAGRFYKADGTFIKELEDGPLNPQEADLIYTGGRRDNRGWTSSIRLDKDGHPVIGYTVYKTNEDHRYGYARFDGRTWHNHEVAFGGSCFWEKENDYTGLITIDPTDANTIYLSTNVDPRTGKKTGTGKHEIYKAITADWGRTWAWTAITANSKLDNIRPVIPPSDGKNHALLWLRGTYTSFIDYDLDTVGIVKALD